VERKGMSDAKKVQAAVAMIEAGKKAVNLSGLSLNTAHRDALVAAVRRAGVTGKLGLRTLNLLSCKLGDAGMLQLCPALAKCKSLHSLILQENGLSAVAAQALAAALVSANCPVLTLLNLGNNPISDASAIAIASLLNETSSMKALFLNNCGITSAGVEALAAAAARSTRLERLNLDYNNIADVGAVTLAAMMANSPCLMSLDLDQTGITDVGATALAVSLEKSRSMEVLGLRGNRIADVGAMALADAAARSRNLVLGKLHNNRVSPGAMNYVRDTLARAKDNRRILALMSAFVPERDPALNPPAFHFVRRDGDHAIGHRITLFLLSQPPRRR
jgi:Ran GTPase-activating protein (RanGAP) involved in mRNA processing and transport